MKIPLFVTERGAVRLLAIVATAVLTFIGLLSPIARVNAFDPWWVQTLADSQLWSGPDDKAVSFGPVPKGIPLLVIAPQVGDRLYVRDSRTNNVAYVNASAVGPAAPPRLESARGATPTGPDGVKRTPPKAPAGFATFWVANYEETDMWSGPEEWATSVGVVPQFRRFLVIEPQKGDRLKVWSPETDSAGYLDAAMVGPVGPSLWLEPHPLKITGQVRLPGRSVGDSAYARNMPVVADETEMRHLPNNTAITIQDEGVSPDGKRWYTLPDGTYIEASSVRLPTPPPSYSQGKWIDADLSGPAMVTAYEGDKIVRVTMAIIGTDATPTLTGNYKILRRVENETMDSSTLGIPRDAPGGYYLKDVLYTQYFTPQGAALHYNYWIGTFGSPGSHGCLGLSLEDSRWFWDWATVGTPVIVR